jgi:CRISPR-associated protein Csd1
MILQSLCQYYERLAKDPDGDIPKIGYARANVSFALNLSADGKLLDVIDLRVQRNKRLVGTDLEVPQPTKRTAGVGANFLCDNSGYVLGADSKGKPERTAETFEAYRDLHVTIIGDSPDPGLRAVCRFVETWNQPEAAGHAKLMTVWEDLVGGGNIVFRLDGELGYIHDRPAARTAWDKHRQAAISETVGQCLITGQFAPIARLHPAIKGVRGAQSSGAALVSFNIASFESFGKEHNFNAPIGEPAAFAYTTALNRLLTSDRQRIQIGDATTVFWAERACPAENLMPAFFDPPPEPQAESERESRYDPKTTRLIRDILACARDGLPISNVLPGDPKVRFFVLGLAPNNARLAVRFWHIDTLASLAEKVGRHYADLSIERQFPSEDEFISVWRILKELAVLRETKNIPPALAGPLVRAILTGGDYPQAIYTALIGRIRADREINYVRAALVKAYLLRAARRQRQTLQEATMSLNEESTNSAYRLGRLFAVLEKVQEDASGGSLNATIKDRYFGSASATPASIFPILIRLAQHHVAKAEYGRLADRRIEEIVTGLESFPKRLDLNDQGLFILGYYHQRNAFFRKSDPNNKGANHGGN